MISERKNNLTLKPALNEKYLKKYIFVYAILRFYLAYPIFWWKNIFYELNI